MADESRHDRLSREVVRKDVPLREQREAGRSEGTFEKQASDDSDRITIDIQNALRDAQQPPKGKTN
jgi:hypothetical protein